MVFIELECKKCLFVVKHCSPLFWNNIPPICETALGNTGLGETITGWILFPIRYLGPKDGNSWGRLPLISDHLENPGTINGIRQQQSPGYEIVPSFLHDLCGYKTGWLFKLFKKQHKTTLRFKIHKGPGQTDFLWKRNNFWWSSSLFLECWCIKYPGIILCYIFKISEINCPWGKPERLFWKRTLRITLI